MGGVRAWEIYVCAWAVCECMGGRCVHGQCVSAWEGGVCMVVSECIQLLITITSLSFLR